MNNAHLSAKAAAKDIHTLTILLSETAVSVLQELSRRKQKHYSELIVDAIDWLSVCELDYQDLLDSKEQKTHKKILALTCHQIQDLWNIQQAWFLKNYSLSSVINAAILMYVDSDSVECKL